MIFAVIAGDGSILSGAATSVTHTPLSGIYFVNFGADVSACAGVVSAAGGSAIPNVSMGFPTSTEVGIGLVNSAGTFIDVQFSIIIAC